MNDPTSPDYSRRGVACRGRVAVAPANSTSPMTVVLPNYSNSLDYEVVAGHWAPRGVTLPTIDDECLVVFDDEGDAWVPVWSP